jgi:hypothetical protein
MTSYPCALLKENLCVVGAYETRKQGTVLRKKKSRNICKSAKKIPLNSCMSMALQHSYNPALLVITFFNKF